MRHHYAAGSTQYAERTGTRPCAARALPAARCLPPTRRGFTFTEVLFAVILLGIGFIMLAGMFPVAIQQTAQTQQETVGASLAVAAVKQMSQAITQDAMPPTGGPISGGVLPPMVLPFRERFWDAPGDFPDSMRRTIDTASGNFANQLYNPLWKLIRGDVIFSEDPRYAFVPFYQRAPGQNVARIIVIALQSRMADQYEFNRDVITQIEYQSPNIKPDSPYAVLEPRRLEAMISDGGPDVDIIEIRAPRGLRVSGTDPVECAEVGAFVVVSDDRQKELAWHAGSEPGRANGRIYRLGARRPDLDKKNLTDGITFELAPGYDLADRMENLPMPNKPQGYLTDPKWAQDLRNTNLYVDHDGRDPAIVYIVGRPQQEPDKHKSPYTGLTQDLAAYTTYINLK